MRRIILALGIVAGVYLSSITAADACGDKSLRIGRGVRFQRTAHPAAVLIYLPSNASAIASARAPKLQSFFKTVGHKSQTVQGADMLSEALKSGRYDVVLTDLTEAANLQKQIDTAASKPVVVPVASKETKAEVAAARKQYGYIVKDPRSGDEYLDAIEGAMRSRVRVLQRKA